MCTCETKKSDSKWSTCRVIEAAIQYSTVAMQRSDLIRAMVNGLVSGVRYCRSD
jgi:hypothetical protein